MAEKLEAVVENVLIIVGVAVLLLAILGAAVVAGHKLLDMREDWDPFAQTAVLPAVVGQHRLELAANPFRLPAWD